jgi:predicted AlkP superfamily phosphohydrolase/phosphomutase
MKEKTVVLGFDGMDIRYLEDAMEERDLPNFEKLKEEGTLGEMTSVHPPTTIPAWQCMFTGKNPGKLGIFHFQDLNTETGEFEPYDLTEVYGSFIWDSGIETALNFLPSVSPPYEINGRIVEGIPGPKDFRTYPEDLKDDIVNEDELEVFSKDFNSKMNKSMSYYSTRKKIMRRVMENYEQDLLVNVYRPTDSVAHFGTSMEEFYDVYEEMDEELGYYMDRADEEGFQLFLVADHGANHTERAFFINTWLEQKGHLKLNDEGETAEKKLHLRIANRLINLGLRKPLDTAHNLLERFTGVNLKPDKHSVSEQVDWDNSQGVAYLIGALPVIGVMLNEEMMDEKELEITKDEIIEELEKEDAIKWVKTREEVFDGDRVDELPHLIVRGKDNVMMKSMIYPDVEIKFDKYGHGYAGVFGAYGRHIQHHEDYKCSLLDIAPTLMLSLREKIPTDTDGEALVELFDDDREPSYGNPIQEEVDEEDDDREEKIKSRLEEMGYMRD